MGQYHRRSRRQNLKVRFWINRFEWRDGDELVNLMFISMDTYETTCRTTPDTSSMYEIVTLIDVFAGQFVTMRFANLPEGTTDRKFNKFLKRKDISYKTCRGDYDNLWVLLVHGSPWQSFWRLTWRNVFWTFSKASVDVDALSIVNALGLDQAEWGKREISVTIALPKGNQESKFENLFVIENFSPTIFNGAQLNHAEIQEHCTWRIFLSVLLKMTWWEFLRASTKFDYAKTHTLESHMGECFII